MNERFPADQERPTIPWGGLILVVLTVFGAITLVGFVLRTVFLLVKLAIVVVIAVAVISLIMGRKTDR